MRFLPNLRCVFKRDKYQHDHGTRIHTSCCLAVQVAALPGVGASTDITASLSVIPTLYKLVSYAVDKGVWSLGIQEGTGDSEAQFSSTSQLFAPLNGALFADLFVCLCFFFFVVPARILCLCMVSNPVLCVCLPPLLTVLLVCCLVLVGVDA